MRGVLVTALTATLAIFVFAGAKPASALPAAAALNYSQTNGDLIQVKRWYKRRYRYPRRYYGRRYYRPYRYYYRPYGYYRPYRYYYRPYYYYRPGVSIWLGW
jgi:hypothetical protein